MVPLILRRAALFALLLSWLSPCLGQWTTGPKLPCDDRVKFKVFEDTMLVRRDLHDTKRIGKAFGAIHTMGWWADRSGHYPGNRLDLPENRIITTDTMFKRGSDHMLTGVFQFFYRNGSLMQEYVFSDGYILSDKRYRKDGSLVMWLDYDIAFDSCLFSCFVQTCRKEKDREWTTESIFTHIDKRPGSYRPDYAWKALRLGWRLECEIWAAPIQLMPPEKSTFWSKGSQRAVDVMIIRPDRASLPAYVAVQLPDKECAGIAFSASDLQMTLTHADGRTIERVRAVAPAPYTSVSEVRKPLLEAYYYFPLGDNTTDGFKAYDLSAGTYLLNVYSQPDPGAAPILLGSTPLEVIENR